MSTTRGWLAATFAVASIGISVCPMHHGTVNVLAHSVAQLVTVTEPFRITELRSEALPTPEPLDTWVPTKSKHGESTTRVIVERGENAHAPPIVMLGGMCSLVEWTCGSLNAAGDEHAFVCPKPTGRCSNGTPNWDNLWMSAYDLVDQSVTSVARAHPEAIDRERAILAGFSMGALVAANYVMSRPGYRRVLLAGAFVQLEVETLRKNGVERVLLASNDWDMARPSMVNTAKKLSAQGFAARFLSTGPGGHGFAPSEAWWKMALAWLQDENLASLE